jgi:hypothetical protein
MVVSFVVLAIIDAETLLGDDWIVNALFAVVTGVGVVMHSVAVWLLTTPLNDDAWLNGRRLARVGVAFAPLCMYSLLIMYGDWPYPMMWPQMLIMQAVSISYLIGLVLWLRRLEWRTAAWVPGLSLSYIKHRRMVLLLLVPFGFSWWAQSQDVGAGDYDWGMFWALAFVVGIAFVDVRRVRRSVQGELAAIRRGELSFERW